MGQDFSLYASKETLAAIPPEDLRLLEKLLPKWAGSNVIIVSPADVNQGLDPKTTAPERLYTKQFQSFLGQLPLTRNGADNDGKKKDDRANLQAAYVRASKGDFSAVDSNTFKQTGMMTVAVNYSDINKLIPAGLAGLKPEMLGKVPGTSTDWMLATVAHESGHLSSAETDAREETRLKNQYAQIDLTNVHNNNRESEADIKGLKNYFLLHAQMPDIDPKVPAAFMALRAIGTIHQSGDALSSYGLNPSDHATSPALKISGTTVKPQTDMRSNLIDAAVIDMNTKIHLMMGLEVKNQITTAAKTYTGQKTDAILNQLNDPEIAQVAAKIGATPDSISDLKIGDGRAELLRAAATDPKGREAISTLMVGGAMANKEPLREYATVKVLYEKGEFKSDVQKKIAKEYLDAFEKYVPAATQKPCKDLIAQLKKEWPALQQQEKDMAGASYIQKAVDTAKVQFHEPNAVLEASAPPPTGMA